MGDWYTDSGNYRKKEDSFEPIQVNVATFKYIKADQFFKDYLPHIKSYKHKIRGKNGRGNSTDFTEHEKNEIKEAIKKLFKELI